ncbi:MAG: hypothetical protein H0X66_20075 [Verrucomicrobia bacterium]|nr:hypothetical protein [Verrucomicrobiota bacterium]
MRYVKPLFTVCAAAFLFCSHGFASGPSFGPFYDQFPLTLSRGERTEAAGPFYIFEQRETQQLWAVPPLFSYFRDPDLESAEFDLAYPLLTYDRYGREYRFQILQLFAFAGGQDQEGDVSRRFTLFPIYFQQRSPAPEENYTALVPIYGHLQNRLFRDEIDFVLFPLYGKSRKRDVVTWNYLYPVFHRRLGDALSGWQVWPLVGHEHKHPTTRTNIADDIEIIGGHDKFFALWPIFLDNEFGLGTDNPQRQLSVLPLFTSLRSPQRDSLTAPWPIGLTLTDDREKKYKEVGAPWPFIVFARGENRHVSRVWPLYSKAQSGGLESSFYLWPIYRHTRIHSPPLDRDRTRILFFLYSDINLRHTETGVSSKRSDFWPLFTYTRDLDQNKRLQVFSLLEPLLPNNKSIERNYSQLWSVWRSERNGKTGASSQSLLWNLYRRDVTQEKTKTSVLLGLFQREKMATGTDWKIFHIPLGKKTGKDEALK